MKLKPGRPGQHGWTHSLDGDVVHPDWEHTLDYDYQPKGTQVTPDGDLVLPDNPSTSHLPKRDPTPWI